MAEFFTVTPEAQSLLAALERVGPRAESLCRAAAHETARRIQSGIRARAQWGATGQTREAITVEEAPGPLGGYRVFVGRTNDAEGLSRPANLPLWLEFGTKKWAGHPGFFFGPARLEEGPHLRRIAEALQAVFDELGLGG